MIPKEVIRELIKEQNFTNTTDVKEPTPKNYRNGNRKKTIKTQLGKVEITVPRDRNGEYEPQIIGKYQRNADGVFLLAYKNKCINTASGKPVNYTFYKNSQGNRCTALLSQHTTP
jgi:transposase-like protein